MGTPPGRPQFISSQTLGAHVPRRLVALLDTSRARTTSAADKWSGGRSSARSSSSDRDGGYRGCAVRPERAPDPPEVEPDPLGLVLPPLRDRAPALDPPPERGRPLV